MFPAVQMEAGDVVVRASGGRVGPAFVLRTIPGPNQVGFATLVEATNAARAYGEHAVVNAWVENVNGTMPSLLVARFRPDVGCGGRLVRPHGAETPAVAAAISHASSRTSGALATCAS